MCMCVHVPHPSIISRDVYWKFLEMSAGCKFELFIARFHCDGITSFSSKFVMYLLVS